MTIFYRSKLFGLSAGAMFALALGGCHDNGNNSDGELPPAAANVNDLATMQINQKTCETRTPDEVNSIALGTTEAAIDIDTLTPACVGSI